MGIETTQGILLEDGCSLSLVEFSGYCQGGADWVLALVDEGILEPVGSCADDWLFAPSALRLALAAQRLQQDFDINLAAVALVLELRREVERLRTRLAVLEVG